MKEPFKGGHKFPNGLPLTDELKKTLDEFYEYAKAQGETRSKREFFAEFEKMLTGEKSFKK